MEEIITNFDLRNPNFYWDFFITQFQTNQLFTGLLVLSVMGSFGYIARDLPKILWSFLVNQLTVHLKIQNNDILYEYLKIYLSEIEYVKTRCRRLTLSSTKSKNSVYNSDEETTNLPTFTLTPMDGNHWFFYKKNLVFYKRTIDEEKGNERKETITLRYIGRNRKLIFSLVEDIQKIQKKKSKNIKLYMGTKDWWDFTGEKMKRPLETVFMPDGEKEFLINDIRWFYDNPEWYVKRGIPYHRGYLFSGEPGCGKTSIIKAICSELDKKMAICNLSTIIDDRELLELISNAPEDSIVIIEDIDGCSATHQRTKKQKKQNGVTITGMLNALDGMSTPDKQIFIMTTNHPDKLDPALMRCGRIDIHMKFNLMEKDLVEKMFIAFFPEHKKHASDVSRNLTKNGPVSPADIQGKFFECTKNPKNFIKEILK